MLKMSDIAKHVGVSATTVSLVLNESADSARFSEKTRLQVLQAAEELGYRSNRMAKAVRTGNTRMLGVLGGRASEEHVGKMLEGALEAADAEGYTLKLLRLHAIGNSAQQAIRNISELRLTGVVALHLPDLVLEALYTEAEKCRTPLVLMNTPRTNPAIPQVTSDDDAGFTLGIDHLVSLGHTKIGLISGGGETAIGVKRREAFRKGLARHGLKMNPEYIREGSFHQRTRSVDAALALLSQPTGTRPTAIFCASDLMALATLRAAHQLGIEVPGELSVLGYANMRAADYASPALTTIDEPFNDIGRMTVNMLLGIIRERGQERAERENSNEDGRRLRDDAARNTVLLSPQLVERESTAPPRV